MMMLGSHLSEQQATLAIGTLFAFLVKARLIFATSVAFVQVFWKEAKAQNAIKQVSLDTWYSALSNAFVLFNIPLWSKCPILLIIATMVWCVSNSMNLLRSRTDLHKLIPTAAIIPPATLSIRTAAVDPALVVPLRVPNLDFRSLAFVADMPEINTTTMIMGLPSTLMSGYAYHSPSQAVSNTSNAVMALGQILPITPPATNASWELDFYGPSLNCVNVSNETRLHFEQNIGDYFLAYQSDVEREPWLWIPCMVSSSWLSGV